MEVPEPKVLSSSCIWMSSDVVVDVLPDVPRVDGELVPVPMVSELFVAVPEPRVLVSVELEPVPTLELLVCANTGVASKIAVRVLHNKRFIKDLLFKSKITGK